MLTEDATPSSPSKDDEVPLPRRTRGYQQEMLDESLRRNVIIALDTGSGKTHIALLRMKNEIERKANKISWFLTPTVALCEQQFNVIKAALPVSVGIIIGALQPDQWKDPDLWKTVVNTHEVVVSTPQVLLDALRHAYLDMGRDIGLLVLDEAHHAVDNHPYRLIMKEFYFRIPTQPQTSDSSTSSCASRPAILGLTASPIFGGDPVLAFRTLELNLDAIVLSTKHNRHELSSFVHRPHFKHVMYSPPQSQFSTNLAALQAALDRMNIEQDPYVKSLQRRLQKLGPHSQDRSRVDQKLSKALFRKDTVAHKGMRDFCRAALDICDDIGAWAADWFVYRVVERVMEMASNQHDNMLVSWREEEKRYLTNSLPNPQQSLTPPSYFPDDIVDDSSPKVSVLVDCLLSEKAQLEAQNEAFSGIIFVQRRDAVYALATVLTHHPQTRDEFKIGCLVGSSDNTQRHTFLDITRTFLAQTQSETLADFAMGEKNLLISTSVAEEGIDIQGCGCVIRWDPPPNMVSWVQSRGRARRERSTFVSIFAEGGVHDKHVAAWENLERKMVDEYQRDRLSPSPESGSLEEDMDDEDDDVLFVPATGATMTLHSVIGHLDHFCAVIPSTSNVNNRPIYDLDPPDMPEGWHAFEVRRAPAPNVGPFGATVTLPRSLDQTLRVFQVPTKYPTKTSAFRHVAFKAYSALYRADLLNDNLLPHSSVVEPPLEEEVQRLLQDVEKRASMANVSVQMNPWSPYTDIPLPSHETSTEEMCWWEAQFSVEGLPPLRVFTRRPLTAWTPEDGPILYRRGFTPAVPTLTSSSVLLDAESVIPRAQEYTRRVLWAVHGSRMNWNNVDFHYLFLPAGHVEDTLWEQRRLWGEQLCSQRGKPPADALFANAREVGEHFLYPDDLTLVKTGFRFHKSYQFVRWTFDEPNEEQILELEARYKRPGCLDATLPLLIVHEIPSRTNFLHPTANTTLNSSKPYREFLLDPQQCGVVLHSRLEIEYANLLPSVIRAIACSSTVQSLRNALFTGDHISLLDIPASALLPAITAPAASEHFNYQRLETLGDTVLKFVVAIQLLSRHRNWHEGYLSKRKDHIVSNVCLAKHAAVLGIHQWIIRDRLISRKWKPTYFSASNPSSPQPPQHEGTREQEQSTADHNHSGPKPTGGKPKKTSSEQLSTKVLADVVEALIGAAYLHGSFELGLQCARLFDLGAEWHSLPCCIQTILDRVGPDDDIKPAQFVHVEQMLGYTFKRKLLLVEALTHASYQGTIESVSYGRMEFLGDSVLDMIVTDFLYHAPGKSYSPGHIFLRRSAMVNAHMLAYICLRTQTRVVATMPKPQGRGNIAMQDDIQFIQLHQCLLHSSPAVLDDQRQTFTRYQKLKSGIEEALQSGSIYPWASLLRLQAPKFLSDMIESLLGAVYLDSNGDLDAARAVARTLGIMDILERIVRDGVDVLHPVSRVGLWAQGADKKVNYRFEKNKGQVCCVVEVDGEVVVEESAADLGRASAEEVKFVAAEALIRMMNMRDVGLNYDEMKNRRRKSKEQATAPSEGINIDS
ncbi:hypothetical protein HGRIS_003938 [Hohenbuehelia grisea]|uniref:Dicer-like protein 2 n=1 Tax=Hohenbuehelia grisea TaxID=104357 RepID=A0ABR3JH64_9AGAR